MSDDEAIVAWREEDQVLENKIDSRASGEAGEERLSSEADTDSQQVEKRITRAASSNISIGSFDGSFTSEEDKRASVRSKKASLCSTLSSGDHPYLSLISSERREVCGQNNVESCRHQSEQEGLGGNESDDDNVGSQ